MANIPSNVSFGTVKARFILAYSDSVDSGSEPDALPAAGSVFFTASPILLKNASASPDPVTILPAPVEVPLDADGYLRSFAGEAGLGVRLVATDDPDNNPVNWTWRADFRLTDPDGTPVSLPSFSFSLPSNATVDLTDLSPVPSADGTFYLVGPAGPANVLTAGTVTTGAAGSSAAVTITGTSPAQTINFTIPQGIQGIQGEQGPTGATGPEGDAATIAVGTVTTGTPTTAASVTNVGTTGAAVFDFVIPKGETGSLGDLSADSPVTYISNTIGFDWSATELDDLGNVDVATPTDGDLLKWNEPSGAWESANLIDGGTA
jgi:hypothetical protein